MVGISALSPKSRGQSVYAQIKRDLIERRIAPGTEMQEEELAVSYGGSRTPVREALVRLTGEQLISRNGRFYVAREFRSRDIRDIYELREALECAAARLAAERMSDGGLAELEQQLVKQAAAVERADWQLFDLLDVAFHRIIARECQNIVIQHQVDLILDQVRAIRARELNLHLGPANAVDGHRRIFDALRRRNQEIAAAEMRYHIREVAKVLET